MLVFASIQCFRCHSFPLQISESEGLQLPTVGALHIKCAGRKVQLTVNGCLGAFVKEKYINEVQNSFISLSERHVFVFSKVRPWGDPHLKRVWEQQMHLAAAIVT